MRARLGLAMAVVLGIAGAARAAPLDLKQVSADAKWVVHIDFDAVQEATLAQKAREQFIARYPAVHAILAMIGQQWKFDPHTDLHGITLYGDRMTKNAGVAIVSAKVDGQLLLERVKAAPEYRATSHGKYELHTWRQAQDTRRERTLTGAFYKPDVMVFGATVAEVAGALDVLDGAKANFSGKEASLGPVGAAPPGAALMIGAMDVADARLPWKSPLSKQIDAVGVVVGEKNGEAFVLGKLAVKRADIAQEVKTVLEGARALATLAHYNNPEAAKVIGAWKFTADENTVYVQWRGPADLVWKRLQRNIDTWTKHLQKLDHKPPRRNHAPENGDPMPN